MPVPAGLGRGFFSFYPGIGYITIGPMRPADGVFDSR